MDCSMVKYVIMLRQWCGDTCRERTVRFCNSIEESIEFINSDKHDYKQDDLEIEVDWRDRVLTD